MKKRMDSNVWAVCAFIAALIAIGFMIVYSCAKAREDQEKEQSKCMQVAIQISTLNYLITKVYTMNKIVKGFKAGEEIPGEAVFLNSFSLDGSVVFFYELWLSEAPKEVKPVKKAWPARPKQELFVPDPLTPVDYVPKTQIVESIVYWDGTIETVQVFLMNSGRLMDNVYYDYIFRDHILLSLKTRNKERVFVDKGDAIMIFGSGDFRVEHAKDYTKDNPIPKYLFYWDGNREKAVKALQGHDYGFTEKGELILRELDGWPCLSQHTDVILEVAQNGDISYSYRKKFTIC